MVAPARLPDVVERRHRSSIPNIRWQYTQDPILAVDWSELRWRAADTDPWINARVRDTSLDPSQTEGLDFLLTHTQRATAGTYQVQLRTGNTPAGVNPDDHRDPATHDVDPSVLDWTPWSQTYTFTWVAGPDPPVPVPPPTGASRDPRQGDLHRIVFQGYRPVPGFELGFLEFRRDGSEGIIFVGVGDYQIDGERVVFRSGISETIGSIRWDFESPTSDDRLTTMTDFSAWVEVDVPPLPTETPPFELFGGVRGLTALFDSVPEITLYRIRVRLQGTSDPWVEFESSTTRPRATGLMGQTEYEVQGQAEYYGAVITGWSESQTVMTLDGEPLAPYVGEIPRGLSWRVNTRWSTTGNIQGTPIPGQSFTTSWTGVSTSYLALNQNLLGAKFIVVIELGLRERGFPVTEPDISGILFQHDHFILYSPSNPDLHNAVSIDGLDGSFTGREEDAGLGHDAVEVAVWVLAPGHPRYNLYRDAATAGAQHINDPAPFEEGPFAERVLAAQMYVYSFHWFNDYNSQQQFDWYPERPPGATQMQGDVSERGSVNQSQTAGSYNYRATWSGNGMGVIDYTPPGGDDMWYLWIDLNTDGTPDTTALSNQWDRVLGIQARWGRSEAAYLARCLPMQMTVTLENEDGRFDPRRQLPNARVLWQYRLGGVFYDIAAGFLSLVRPSVDHRTGLRTAILRVQGLLARMVDGDHELSLFTTESIRTGTIVTNALDQVGYPATDRDIDDGQVRLFPAHYINILASRRIGKALAVLQGSEEAEAGLLHEKRGRTATFRHRFHRELDVRQPTYSFGTNPGQISVLGRTDPNDSWDNIYTLIRIGADRGVVLADRRVWTFRKETIGDDPLVLAAGETYDYYVNLAAERRNLENAAVQSVVEWTTHTLAGMLTEVSAPANFSVMLTDRTATGTRVRITNNSPSDAVVTEFGLNGRGIGIYGDLTLTLPADQETLNLYGSRPLDLPHSFIGDGLNEAGDAVAEGRAFAQLLLRRYDHPQLSGRLVFDPLENPNTVEAMVNLQIGDPVAVSLTTGMPTGTYHVEGGDMSFDPRTGWAEMGIHVSARGRRTVLLDTAIGAVSPVGTDWAQAGADYALGDGLFVVAVEASFPAGTNRDSSNDVVLELTVGGETRSRWVEDDIPVGETMLLAAAVQGPGALRIRARRRAAGGNALTVHSRRVVRIET